MSIKKGSLKFPVHREAKDWPCPRGLSGVCRMLLGSRYRVSAEPWGGPGSALAGGVLAGLFR